MKDTRPNWDEFFMGIVLWTATRGACYRRKNSAVIVKDNRIISTGYNSTPKGLENCFDIGVCFREEKNIKSGERYELCRAIHGEHNAILQQAILSGESTKGAKMYITRYPCIMCAKDIVQAEISEIIYNKGPEYNESKEILEKGNVQVRKFTFTIEDMVKFLEKNKEFLKDI